MNQAHLGHDVTHLWLPDDVWREILTKINDYRNCLAIYLTSKLFRKIIQRRFEITALNKDLLCTLIGPKQSGKTTFIARLGVLFNVFPLNEVGSDSLVDSLNQYTAANATPESAIYTKVQVEIDDKVRRKVTVHDVKKPQLAFAYRKSLVDVAIFVTSLKQAIDDSRSEELMLYLNQIRLCNLSKIIVVISHMGTTQDWKTEYEDVCKKYTEVYRRYSVHWKRLQLRIVPVDSITGWNFLPRKTDTTNEQEINALNGYNGPSFLETLGKFHAEGLPIDCPWHAYSINMPANNTMQVYLSAGELKVGEFLNAEIPREIEEICVGQTSVKSTYARPGPITLKLKGTTDPIPRLFLYGPGVRSASRLVARMIFLAATELPLRDVTVRSTGGPVAVKRFTVLHGLDPITYEHVDRPDVPYILADEVLRVELELARPIRTQLESTFPELAKFFLRMGSSPASGAVIAIGMTIDADFAN